VSEKWPCKQSDQLSVRKYAWPGGYYAEKLAVLLTIIKNTRDHLVRTTTHARDNAFLMLALQILVVVRELSADAGEPWSAQDYYGEEAGEHGKEVKK
jgi:hypothetical protein